MDRKKALDLFGELLDIMDKLRAECPWDKEQTFESLRHLSIEETYELSEAVISKDYGEIPKELGDLLLHIVFYAKIGEEQKYFDITNVIDSINKKLVRRHPHIFSDVEAKDAKTVLENWEDIKLKEKGRKTVLEGVPRGLPAMVKAYRIQGKASGVGFDWDKPEQVLEKVKEEYGELQVEIEGGSKEKITDEFGDLLFALVNYARLLGIEPDEALEHTNRKFINRFNYLESKTIQQGKSLHDMSLDEMNKYWEDAKSSE
jgi:XTP/dITP diphosphohydrolase